MNTIESSIDKTTSSLAGKARGSGITDFMNSNSIIARVSFILLIVFIFIILSQIITNIISWYYQTGSSPHLLDGMINATHSMVISQDPNNANAIPITKSNNQQDGLEFTWSTWLFVNDVAPNSTYRHVFHKGNYTMNASGLNAPNNGPGLYLTPDTNNLAVVMSTYDNSQEEIIVEDIPLNKWFNVIIRVTNQTLDIYINGVVTKSLVLRGVPKQNYGDVFIASNGGFVGYISNLWYFDYATNAREIYNLVQNGPDTTLAGSSAVSDTNSNYLSMKWYFSGQGDMYNP
jgi:hypothetical protein|tara:strand:+ start:954 stop:1817 length:864 start_codon:yes stop_codon:yes gene_type:complete